MKAPDVSVIVCTCNRAGMLRDAIESLVRLETHGQFGYEIVVVDNASTDNTADVIAALQQQSPIPIRAAHEPCRGIVPARNRGLATAGGEWTAWFDDDQLADPLWLHELLACAHRHQTRCVGGAVHLKLPEGCERELAPFCQGLLGQSVGGESERTYDHRFTPGAGNLLVRADVFRQLGPFRDTPEQRGEDTELFHKLRAEGIVSWYTPAAIVQHIIPPERLNVAYLTNVAQRSGQGVARRELRRRSSLLWPLLWSARGGQASGHAVRWAWHRLRRDDENALAARCRLAMASGYFRQCLSELMRPAATTASPAHSPSPALATTSKRNVS